jgi:hypothetical protein
MKESLLYINFAKSFLLLFVLFGLLGLIFGYYFASRLPTYYLTEKLYQFSYTLENAVSVEKESDQVVAILRSSHLKQELLIQSSQISIYKPGPFLVSMQVKSVDAEQAVNNLNTLSGYLTQNYKVNEIGKETFNIENKPYPKFSLIGFLIGEVSALIISLFLSYFKKY